MVQLRLQGSQARYASDGFWFLSMQTIRVALRVSGLDDFLISVHSVQEDRLAVSPTGVSDANAILDVGIADGLTQLRLIQPHSHVLSRIRRDSSGRHIW